MYGSEKVKKTLRSMVFIVIYHTYLYLLYRSLFSFYEHIACGE